MDLSWGQPALWFECKTVHGTSLTIDNDHRLCHGETAENQVLLFWPSGSRALAFLIARDSGVRFSVAPSLYQAPAIAVLIKRQAQRVTLTLAEDAAFISAEITETGHNAVANRRFANEWEHFTLNPLSADDVCESNHDFGRSIETCLSKASDAIGLARSLSDEQDLRALEAVLPHLSQRCRGDLSNILLRNPEMSKSLADKFSHDPWAVIAAPALANWLFDKSAANAVHETAIGPELDWLGHRYLPERRRGIRPMSASEMIVRHVRQEAGPSKSACILATARNEGIYYLEWIAYHRAIGFEHFFIYTNDNDDLSNQLLSALAEAGVIDVVFSTLGTNQNAQAKAYGHALGFNPKLLDYAWTMVCDLDEFLLLDENYFSNLQDFLAWHERAAVDCINISWSHVSASGQVTWDDRPLIDRFATPHFWLDSKIKSIFRTARAVQSYAHFPVEPSGERLIYRNAVGDIRSTHKAEDEHGIHGRHLDDDPDYRFATVLHYYWKSAEEFLWKHSRNKGDHARVKGRDISRIHPAEIKYFLDHAGIKPEGQAHSAPRKFARQFDSELAYLRALPNVALAEVQVKQNFRAAIAQLKMEFLQPENLERLGLVGQQFAQLFTLKPTVNDSQAYTAGSRG